MNCPRHDADEWCMFSKRDPLEPITSGDPAKLAPDLAAESRRGTGRLREDGLTCSIGELMNISAGGFQALCKKVPTEPTEVTFSDGDRHVTAVAKVTWQKQQTRKQHLVGFQFVETEFNLVRRLKDLAMNQHIKRVI